MIALETNSGILICKVHCCVIISRYPPVDSASLRNVSWLLKSLCMPDTVANTEARFSSGARSSSTHDAWKNRSHAQTSFQILYKLPNMAELSRCKVPIKAMPFSECRARSTSAGHEVTDRRLEIVEGMLPDSN